MTLVLIDTIMMLMDMMICYRKTITGGPGILFHSELTWVPPGIVQGVPKKRTFRIIILQADTSERSACRVMILKMRCFWTPCTKTLFEIITSEYTLYVQ